MPEPLKHCIFVFVIIGPLSSCTKIYNSDLTKTIWGTYSHKYLVAYILLVKSGIIRIGNLQIYVLCTNAFYSFQVKVGNTVSLKNMTLRISSLLNFFAQRNANNFSIELYPMQNQLPTIYLKIMFITQHT